MEGNVHNKLYKRKSVKMSYKMVKSCGKVEGGKRKAAGEREPEAEARPASSVSWALDTQLALNKFLPTCQIISI